MSINFPTINALGTIWWIEVFDDIHIQDEERFAVIHTDIKAFLFTFEANYSRFKPDSILSQLNATRVLTNPTTEFQTLLRLGIEQYDRTDGIFNMMVGATLVAQGYDKEYSFTPSISNPPTQCLSIPHEVIHITPEKVTLDQGLIDLGGFGKGYAIDQVAQILKAHKVKGFLINGGGDMYATSDQGKPITIYLEHPTIADTYIAETTLLNQGFAASSPYKRSWKYAGVTYTHIIDTVVNVTKNNVGTNARPDATFSKASSACTADIFATVALLASPQQLEIFATKESLGIARYFLGSGCLEHNAAFI